MKKRHCGFVEWTYFLGQTIFNSSGVKSCVIVPGTRSPGVSYRFIPSPRSILMNFKVVPGKGLVVRAPLKAFLFIGRSQLLHYCSPVNFHIWFKNEVLRGFVCNFHIFPGSLKASYRYWYLDFGELLSLVGYDILIISSKELGWLCSVQNPFK